MDSRNYGAPGADDGEDVVVERVVGDDGAGVGEDAEERLGEELAEFAFLREEDDREVRLSFRDMPADIIANAFRRAGALFITLTGERTKVVQAVPVTVSPPDVVSEAVEEEVQPSSRRRRRKKAEAEAKVAQGDGGRTPGELIMRYFYATENIVYTVIIATSTGIINSIEGVYPSAQLMEREVAGRLGVVVGSR